MTGMPTKAITPNTSKLNLAQHERPIAKDWARNLSDNLVQKKFKVLFKNTKQLFTELETEFEMRQIGNSSNILE